MPQKPDLSLDNLKAFFLAGAAATYASGKSPERLPDRPWVKYMEWSDEERFPGLYFRDEWDSSGEESSGKTLILATDDRKHPVWNMAYGGACNGDDKEVLWVHKSALRLAYESGTFCGGRGFPGYQASAGGRFLMYQNRWRGDFAEFDGGENVVDVTHGTLNPLPNALQTFLPGKHDGVLFWHWVHGGLMGRAKQALPETMSGFRVDLTSGEVEPTRGFRASSRFTK